MTVDTAQHFKTCETISDLASGSGYANDTVKNAILDLQNFFQVTRNKENDKIIASEIFLNLKDEEIAEKLAEQIEAHVVVKKIYEQLKPGEWIWQDDFQKLLYDDGKTKLTTAKDYASKMLSWFYFAGLLERKDDWLVVRPTNPKQGKQKGKPQDCDVINHNNDTHSKSKRSKKSVSPGQIDFFDLLQSQGDI